VEAYGLSYDDLKEMARQSLEHSFLPGTSLWAGTKPFRAVGPCQGDLKSRKCQDFINGNEKGRVQWKLEAEFAEFERRAGARE